MKKKVTSAVIFLTLTAFLSSALCISPIKASVVGTIYIRADGSVYPSSVPLQRSGDVYTLTSDIMSYPNNDRSDGIVIEKDDIVLDGAGHMVQSMHQAQNIGIELESRENVTIKNANIKGFFHGIWLWDSYNNIIRGNSIVYGNRNAASVDHGILLSGANNVVSENAIINYTKGISVDGSNDLICGNEFTNNMAGIYMIGALNCNISQNTFVRDGMLVHSSYDNAVEGNLVNGKPLVYLEDVTDAAVEDAGQVILINCDRMRVENLNLSHLCAGIQLCGTNDTTICGNNVADNLIGIELVSSNYNRIIGNSAADNKYQCELRRSNNNIVRENNLTNSGDCTIEVFLSNNNAVYHNNFGNNANQISSDNSTNTWDDGYPSGGNYWSGYTDVDSNSDGIWEHPYIIDANNQDRYPLVNPWVSTSPWPMFQHDPQHTGRSQYVGPSESPEATILLGNQTVNEVFGSPAIGSGGILYLGKILIGGEWGLHALYPNGIQKWSCGIQPSGGGTSLLDPPALCESTMAVYAHTDLEIFAVDIENGNLKWRKAFAYIYSHLVVADDGILYFTALRQLPDNSYRNFLIGLDKNGEEVLTYDIGESPLTPSSPTIGKTGVVYVGYNDTLFAIDPDGIERWRRTFEADIKYHSPSWPIVTAPSIAEDGTIYTVVFRQSDWQSALDQGWYNHLHTIDPENPWTDKWSRRIAYSAGYEDFPDLTPSIDHDGNVYVSSEHYVPGSGAHYSTIILNPTGDEIASFEPSGQYLLIDRENSVFTVRNDALLFFNGEENPTQISLPFQAGSLSPFPALGPDGTLYAGGHKNFYAIRSFTPTPSNHSPNKPEDLSQLVDGITLSTGALTEQSSIEFRATLSDPDGDRVKLQVELRNLHEYGGQFDETGGGFKESSLVANGGEVSAFADDLINEDYHWRARTVDEHGLASEWVDFGGNDILEADFTLLSTNLRDRIVDSLRELKEAIRYKLNHDVGIVAQTFTSVKDYWRVKRWADLAGAGLDAIKDILSIVTIPRKLYDLITNPDPEYQAAKGALELTSLLLMVQGIKRTGENLVTGLIGPAYTNTIHDMLDSADQIFFLNYDSTVYRTFIDTYLKMPPPDKQSPLSVPRKSGDLNRNAIGLYDGMIDLYLSISKTIKCLTDDICKHELPESFPAKAIISELTDLKTGIMRSCLPDPTGGTKIDWDTYLKDGQIYVPKHMSMTFGKPAQLLSVFGSTASSLADKSTVEIRNTFVKTGEAIVECIQVYYMLETNDIFTVKGSYLDTPGMILSGASIWTELELNTYYSDTEKQFYELPQEMVLSLGTEFSNLLMMVDDVDRSIRHEMDISPGMPENEIGAIVAELCSPGVLQIHDSDGRVTGIVNGLAMEEIPNSECFDKTVIILSPNDTYSYRVIGTESGLYGLRIDMMTGDVATSFSATYTPIAAGAIHLFSIDWNALSRGEKGVNLQIDKDGNGLFEYVIISGSELTHLPGDTNSDGKVDILDIATAASAFGSDPAQERWNPVADENDDGTINILDIVRIALNYGRNYT